MSKAEGLAERLRAFADAAVRRRQARPGTSDHDEALREMRQIQRELRDDRPQSSDEESTDGGAISTPSDRKWSDSDTA